MPTFELTAAFKRDFGRLPEQHRQRFLAALRLFIADLVAMEAGQAHRFRPGLRVKGIQSVPGMFEMSWAPDGRATFFWGLSVMEGKRHVIWERCGFHDILP